jgi:RecB family exonuclease
MTIHAKLSASGAHRWMNCPGSVKAEEGFADRSSIFADEGTLAHAVCEQALTHNQGADEASMIVGPGMIASMPHLEGCIDQAFLDACQMYIDYVRAQPGDQRMYEVRVDFSQWVPEGFGTSDVVILDGNTVRIIDLKFGKGVQVDAEKNPQPLLYALGVFNDFGWLADVDQFEMHIVQPRLDHISVSIISRGELMKFGELASMAAELALRDDAPRVPGDKQCRFCKAKATCPALYSMTANAIMSEFEDLDLKPTNTLNDDQLRRALEAKPLIEAWLSSVEQLIMQRIAEGGEFPGFKIVEGRSLRQWKDDERLVVTLERMLGERAYAKKMISPAQAEKLLGRNNKAALADFIVKPRGKPSLTREDDPRPAITVSASDFDSGEDDEK